jgi:ADP-heptose:LPS heptosyltransferase
MEKDEKKILIIKLAALGDVLRTTVVLPGLKRRFPFSEIHWITRQGAVELLTGNPHLSKIFCIEDPDDRARALEEAYDLVINLDEEMEACLLAAQVHAASGSRSPSLVGFYPEKGTVRATPSAHDWFDMSALGEKPRNDELKAANRRSHREIMGAIVGVDVETARPALVLDERARRFAERFAGRHGLAPGAGTVVGLNTGAGGRWQRKAWSAGHTVELAKRLLAEGGLRPVLFGGPNEEARNREIVSAAGAGLIDAGTGNSLSEFAALVSLCDITVVSDSLALHISAALGRKTIALVGPTSAAEIDLYGRGSVLTPPVDCLCCYKPTCDRQPPCLELITPEQVYREIQTWNRIP